MIKLKLKDVKETVRELRSRTEKLQETGLSESSYWELREFLANMPPLNVYKYPKTLDDAWHNARAVIREYESKLLSRSI